MSKQITKIALTLVLCTLLAWAIMGVALWLLWQVDWRAAVGVLLFVIGYALEQAVNTVRKKWQL